MKAKFLIPICGIAICIFTFLAIQTNLFGQDTKKEECTTKVVYLTKATYLEKIHNYEKNKDWKYEGKKPAIIDFYADWCRPCRMVAPILDELSVKYDKKLVIYKVDIEKEKELAAHMGVRSIPMIIFIPATGQPQAVNGALDKDGFEKVISEFLLKK